MCGSEEKEVVSFKGQGVVGVVEMKRGGSLGAGPSMLMVKSKSFVYAPSGSEPGPGRDDGDGWKGEKSISGGFPRQAQSISQPRHQHQGKCIDDFSRYTTKSSLATNQRFILVSVPPHHQPHRATKPIGPHDMQAFQPATLVHSQDLTVPP